MEILIVAAYLAPIIVLMACIGRVGARFLLYVAGGALAAAPVILLYPVVTAALPEIPYPAITVSPLLEEFFKALPVIILAFFATASRDEDVFFCAMASGVGFSLIETWLILDPATLAATAGNMLYVCARSFSTSLMHGCTCGIIGYGIVLVRDFDRRALPALLFGFYTLAATVHALYNLFASVYGEAGAVADLVFPLALFFLLLASYHIDAPALLRAIGAGKAPHGRQ